MKRKETAVILLAGAIIASMVTVAARGALTAGSSADPLLSLDWIRNTFVPQTVSQAEEKMEAGLDAIADGLRSVDASGSEFRLKRGDVLELETGAALTCLAGEMDGNASGGAIVDVTTGTETGRGRVPLVIDHRYLVAEATRASFTVTSDTSVVRVAGIYQLTPSDETDYNALADALNEIGLFRGTGLPYGSGYELENQPTRIQGLVMFLRLIGEEEAALSYSGSAYTFTDVPPWALSYVAYAFDKGYTRGEGIDEERRQVTFGTDHLLAAREYTTFLLRALGYAEETDFHWATSVADARELGILTTGEEKLLADSNFLRSQVVYLSYFALSAKIAGRNTTMLERLTAGGAVNAATARTAMSGVSVQRL